MKPPSDVPGDAGLGQADTVAASFVYKQEVRPQPTGGPHSTGSAQTDSAWSPPSVFRSVRDCAGPTAPPAVPSACCTGTAQARAWRAPRRGCDSHRVARRWNRRSSAAGLWHQHCAAGRWDPRRDAAPHPSQFSPAHSPQTLRHLWSLKHPLSFPPRRSRLTHFPEPHALSFLIRTCLSFFGMAVKCTHHEMHPSNHFQCTTQWHEVHSTKLHKHYHYFQTLQLIPPSCYLNNVTINTANGYLFSVPAGGHSELLGYMITLFRF